MTTGESFTELLFFQDISEVLEGLGVVVRTRKEGGGSLIIHLQIPFGGETFKVDCNPHLTIWIIYCSVNLDDESFQPFVLLISNVKPVVKHKPLAYSPLFLNSWTLQLNPLVKFATVTGVGDVSLAIHQLLDLGIAPLSALI